MGKVKERTFQEVKAKNGENALRANQHLNELVRCKRVLRYSTKAKGDMIQAYAPDFEESELIASK